MTSIGGYFGLELETGKHYHPDALKLNTGRNAFEYILRVNQYQKVFLPYFFCDVLLEPLQKLNMEYEFYSVDKNLEPVFDFEKPGKADVFLYINYFGLKDEYVNRFIRPSFNLILDNSQSFYHRPDTSVDSFYSARKFFGVPDGSYLYTKHKTNMELKQDISLDRFQHLLKHVDISREDGFQDFQANERSLSHQEIKTMSNLTYRMLASINYSEVSERRRRNYTRLHEALRNKNHLDFTLNAHSTPMVYPYLSSDAALRNRLRENKIYTATYWPNVLKNENADPVSVQFASKVIYLPVDQHINELDLDRMIKLIQ